VRQVLITLAFAAAALAGCAIYPAYPPAVVVGPPVVRVYPAPPAVVYRRYYGVRRYYW
jgi:hypothetical protein